MGKASLARQVFKSGVAGLLFGVGQPIRHYFDMPVRGAELPQPSLMTIFMEPSWIEHAGYRESFAI